MYLAAALKSNAVYKAFASLKGAIFGDGFTRDPALVGKKFQGSNVRCRQPDRF